MSNPSRAWSWRHAFASSDLPATTKHVLHTVGMFMNELGEGCYPSVADICRYSGLDKKTVLKHLAAAREAGWLAVSQHGFRGQKWKRNEYAARWPERDLVAPTPPACEPKGGGLAPPPSQGPKVVELAPEGGGIEGPKVVEEVHQDKTSPVTPPETSPDRRARERAPSIQAVSAPKPNSTKDELLAVLDEARAEAVIEHRKRIRKPLTAHAARLLAGKFRQCADPNAAADAMIVNGWQGFEPSWLDGRERSPKGPAPPAARPRPADPLFAICQAELSIPTPERTHAIERR
jgi:hypothetical protein